jgi:hypothetical protein
MNYYYFYLFFFLYLFIHLANYYEMPGDIGYSQLQIRDNVKTKRKTLAWMTGSHK